MKTARAIVVVVLLALSPALAATTTHAQDPDTPPAQTARGYAYPIAWLLPLVMLIGTATVGRALTRDLRDKR